MTNEMIQKNEEKLVKLNNAIIKEKDAFLKATKDDELPIDYISVIENLPNWKEMGKYQTEFFSFYKKQGKDFTEFYKSWKHLQNVYEKLKKVQKLQITLENQRIKVKKANMKNEQLADMPKVFEDLKNGMIKYNVDWTLKQKENLQKEFKKLGREEFLKIYKYGDYELIYKTEEEIKKEIETQVNKLVEDLFLKTKKICGNVEKFFDLRLTTNGSGYPILTGQVVGDKGTASIEPIEAGGYNIQRLHIRYIVKRWA